MKSSWSKKKAASCGKNLLKMRVYTSRLLGKEEDLVMHGGGNTSVKIKEKNIFGETEDILYVKGSGWDLATIEEPGFTPVKLDALHKLVKLDTLSDLDMVKYQRMAVTNPAAPNPSVETILHGIIPYTFVDHTHADAVVIITNSPNGKKQIRDLYGDNMLIVPYVMPGFILAKTIYDMTRDIDWDSLDGMILLNHGIFTFDHSAKQAYLKMIDIVSKAEKYLDKKKARAPKAKKAEKFDLKKLAQIRKEVSDLTGKPLLSKLDHSGESVGFSLLRNLKSIANRGPITPDHIIRTKRTPIIFTKNIEKDLTKYKKEYDDYFDSYNQGEQKLDQAPRWGIIPGSGSLSFGPSIKHVGIIEDISRHTKRAIVKAEKLGAWKTLGKKDLFEMEYWSLEQAKLKKATSSKPMQGKVAMVTGAANGIGKACVQKLVNEGAAVVALDIDKTILSLFNQKEVLGLKCDVTEAQDLSAAIQKAILTFGGIDMLVTNAGIFPPSKSIADMDPKIWDKSLAINLTSHQKLIQHCVPFLELGFDPSIVIIGSKNVPAPGPGASAYSVAKAGLTQLGRIAAMELGPKGIRVNVLHPNAVFDTGIWSASILKARAKHYGMTVQEYKTNNILRTEINSEDVAEMAVTVLGKVFRKVTGAQIPIDGGNDRVI